jgi:CO/xanthine dehydrogenase FAD-binding subunit
VIRAQLAASALSAGRAVEEQNVGVEYLAPTTLGDALAAKRAHPDAVPIMGGTDVMVELNFDRRRPSYLLDLTRVPELAEWDQSNGQIRLGAAVSYARVITELGHLLPGLAIAARTVGSPQIRNRGSVGGNLGAASPAGDSHPPLLAAGADVELASVEGVRRLPVEEFYTGVKRHAGRDDELITAVWVTPRSGPQQFSKIGPRNAMVIAVAAFGIALHPDRREVRTGIGSAAPTPRRARDAERFLSDVLTAAGLWESRGPLQPSVLEEFATRVCRAAAPIDDVRGTAAYRIHALGIMARRTLGWTWEEYAGARRG